MRCVVLTAAGGPEVLAIEERPTPAIGDADVLVRVRGSALNRADLLQRRGKYPAPPGAPADIPGIEFAGEVVRTGTGVKHRRVGDRVFGITGGGAHSEFVAIHENACARIPDSLDWTNAAAVPEAFITAHDAMVSQAGLRSGESVVITAVASGVGLAASSIASAMGATVIGSTRTADKVERARDFGVAHGVVTDADPGELTALVQQATSGAGANVALDLVGGPYFTVLLASLAFRGRLMLIGTVAGASDTVDLSQILRKRLRVQGTVLRSRSLEEKISATLAFEREVVPMLDQGRVRPAIDSVFDMADIARAHERLESNDTFGKVILRGFAE